jgi:hypothetical protein
VIREPRRAANCLPSSGFRIIAMQGIWVKYGNERKQK